MSCKGLHCPGCGDGGGGVAIGVIGAVLLVAGVVAANASAIERFLADLLTVLLVAGIGVAVAGVATVAAVVAVHRRRAVSHAEPLRAASVRSPSAVRARQRPAVLARPVARIDRSGDREFVYQVTERKLP